MASWVFCNRCFQPPQGTACFSLTNCGHVYCDVCLRKGKRDECLICKVPCRTVLLSKRTDSDIQALFMGIDGLCRKYARDTSQVSEFQEKHRRRLVAFYGEKMSQLEESLRRSALRMGQLQSVRLSQQTAFSTIKNPVSTPSTKTNGPLFLPPDSSASARVESMEVDLTPSQRRKVVASSEDVAPWNPEGLHTRTAPPRLPGTGPGPLQNASSLVVGAPRGRCARSRPRGDHWNPEGRRVRLPTPQILDGSSQARSRKRILSGATAVQEEGGLTVPGSRRHGCQEGCGGRPACLKSSRADEGRVGQRMEGGSEPALDWQLFTSEARCARSQADRQRCPPPSAPQPDAASPQRAPGTQGLPASGDSCTSTEQAPARLDVGSAPARSTCTYPPPRRCMGPVLGKGGCCWGCRASL
ncbi:PREDICTED: uncharacterized protein LOC103070421 [Lipotes vexillifer]|uniref:Probable E3 SUMO-protein ligase RNF212 n=1 Tax=Lipotes vexillifer TaxID=118797 RepID=A0A340Y868_LIPVE|nr:PREDICTED: uncharacterized protein LOC103070421 [Lipotes vexillifer]